MIRLFPARRRAEQFDALVEHGRRDDVDRESSDLLELVGALRSVPEPQARPEFVADLRERLMLAAPVELATSARTDERDTVARLTIKPSRTRRERRVGVVLGAAALIGATTSMAVASQSAIPGDALYPLKRAIENTQTGFAVGDDAKGQTVLGNASTRLDEADELAQRGGGSGNATLVAHTINDFTQQFTDGSNSLLADYESNGNQGSIGQIHNNASDSMGALAGLDTLIPGGGASTDGWSAAHDALANAAQTVFTIDAQAVNLCPDCGPGILEVPAQLLAGATQTPTDTSDNVAGGELAGTPSGDASQPKHHNGGKGIGPPSGMNPPETPIELPTAASDTTTDLGDALPTGGTDTSTGGGGTGGGGAGGNGGKHHHVDVTPVTDTVNQVVTGVVAGVNVLLNGLAGKSGE
jgi:hypothetical protein